MDKTREILENKTIDCRGIPLQIRNSPLLMGVVNVTPDSFSDGGRFLAAEEAVAHALKIASEGADILDIGGESTRPGSDPVSAEEELSRVMPVIEHLIKELEIPISIDTRKASVASEALEAGCHMVNDVSACSDEEMVELLCKYNVPVVIMHMKGEPKSMQQNPTYCDVVSEVKTFLRDRAQALMDKGVAKERIIVDPGIGFGKRFRDNLELLKYIREIKSLGYPVLVGASRKRFLGELLNAGTDERLYGNLAVAAKCYNEGVEILRVHDVKPTVELLRVLDSLSFPENYSADW